MVSDPLISTDYWTDLQITRQDVEYLHNHLFELETPLTARELVSVFVDERIRAERLATQQRRQAGGQLSERSSREAVPLPDTDRD